MWTFATRGRERADAARLNVRKRRAERIDRRRDSSTGEVLHASGSAVGHMYELEARRTRKAHSGEMQHRPGRGGAVTRLRRMRTAPLDEVGERAHVGRHERPDRDQEREIAYR